MINEEPHSAKGQRIFTAFRNADVDEYASSYVFVADAFGEKRSYKSVLELIHLPEINILYTTGAVILGMVYNFLPFMILPIYSVLIKIDGSIIEAAEDLGANSMRVFLKL